MGAVFDGGDYLLAYLILMGLALPLCILLAGAAWQFTRRFDLSLVLVAALAALSPHHLAGQLAALLAQPPASGPCPTISPTSASLRSAAYMRLTWLLGLAGLWALSYLCIRRYGRGPWALWPARPGGYTAPCWPRPCCSAAAGAVPLSPSSTTATRISAP